MALIVEDGTGLLNADSFDTLDNIDAYLESTGYADDWADASTVRRERLSRTAALKLTHDFNWEGVLLRTNQSLALPRTSLVDKDGRLITGIPLVVKMAQAELAYYMLSNNYLEDAELGSLDEIKVGPIQLKIADQAKITKVVPDSVLRMLSQFAHYRYSKKRMRTLHLG